MSVFFRKTETLSPEPSICGRGTRPGASPWRTDPGHVCCSRWEDLSHRRPHGRSGASTVSTTTWAEKTTLGVAGKCCVFTLQRRTVDILLRLMIFLSPRERSSPWTRSRIRSIESPRMHRCCIYVASKRIVLTAARLWALTLTLTLTQDLDQDQVQTHPCSVPQISRCTLNISAPVCFLFQDLPSPLRALTGFCWTPPAVVWDRDPTWPVPGAWRRSVPISLCSASCFTP